MAQRMALASPSSGVMTIEEAATLLGIDGVKGTSSNGGAKGASDGLVSISGAGAHAAARILAFSRAAWVHEEGLTVLLGERTRGLQIQALHRRLRIANRDKMCERDPTTITVEEGLAVLPVASTHLHVCLECRRVANSFSSDADKSDSFNELGAHCDQSRSLPKCLSLVFSVTGTSSAMMCTVACTKDNEYGTTHIRCAKRSSAALRSAVSFEERMENVEVEAMEASADACERVLSERSASSESGVAARVRRDAKNALEQRANALACGEQPMLRINLLGKAVRVYNEWFALCSFCGCVLKVTPMHRFGGEICCKRCDAAMLGFDTPATLAVANTTAGENDATFCRFCGKQNTGTNMWKTIKAPLDTGGKNVAIPGPLRTVCYACLKLGLHCVRSSNVCSQVTYCSTHWRPWLTGAHRVMQTRIILSHIAHGAKPVFNALQTAQKHMAADLGFEEEKGSGKGKRGKRKLRGCGGDEGAEKPCKERA